jgi:hypothetical protein
LKEDPRSVNRSTQSVDDVSDLLCAVERHAMTTGVFKEGMEVQVTYVKRLVDGSIQWVVEMKSTVSQAYFALHKTLHKVENIKEKNIFLY